MPTTLVRRTQTKELAATKYELVTVLLPIRNQADHIERVVRTHIEGLSTLPTNFEIVLIPNGSTDETDLICKKLSAEFSNVIAVSSEPGWGRAIQQGILRSNGDLICFASSARIGTKDLYETISVALDNPNSVVKGRRAEQDNGLRHIGSFTYNSLCRLMFGIATKDVNGGPKVFPRNCRQLLNLTQPGYLIDVEFNVVCKENRYPIIEVPIAHTPRHGGVSSTTMITALQLFLDLFVYRAGSLMKRRAQNSIAQHG